MAPMRLNVIVHAQHRMTVTIKPATKESQLRKYQMNAILYPPSVFGWYFNLHLKLSWV